MTPELKDLLTLAAKACGYEIARVSDDGDGLMLVGVQEVWAPHLDDGDGARMEAHLRLEPKWPWLDGPAIGVGCQQAMGYEYSFERFDKHNNDRQAARRWASLRAAAQVGRNML